MTQIAFCNSPFLALKARHRRQKSPAQFFCLSISPVTAIPAPNNASTSRRLLTPVAADGLTQPRWRHFDATKWLQIRTRGGWWWKCEKHIFSKTIEITWISSAVTSSRRLDKLGEQVADVLEYGHNEEGVNDIGGVRRRLGGSVVVCPALVLDHPCRHHSVGNQTKLLSNSSPDELSFSQATLVNFVFWGKPKRPTSVRSTLSPTPSCSSRRSRGHLLGLEASWDSPK